MVIFLIYSLIMVSENSSASECNWIDDFLNPIFRKKHPTENTPPIKQQMIQFGKNDELWKAIPLSSRYTPDGYILDAALPDNLVKQTDWAYHGTSTKFFESIQQNGIDHSKGITVNGGKMQSGKGAASTRSLTIADYFSKRTASRVGDEKVIYRWKTANPRNVNESDLAPPVPAKHIEYSIDGGSTWFKLDKIPLEKARSIQNRLDSSMDDFNVPMTSPVFSNGQLRTTGGGLTVHEFIQSVKKSYSKSELKKLNRSVIAIPSDSRTLMDLESSFFNSKNGLIAYPVHSKKSLVPTTNGDGYPVVFGLNPTRTFSISSSKNGGPNAMWISSGLNKKELKVIFVPKDKIEDVKKRVQDILGDHAQDIQVEDISIFEMH